MEAREQREEQEEKKDGGQERHDLVSPARTIQRHHLRPVPEAVEPVPEPFPAIVTGGLIVGVVLGALTGLIFGVLLQSHTLVLPGLQGLFSMGPFTFVFFWIMMGIAGGIFIVGSATILKAAR